MKKTIQTLLAVLPLLTLLSLTSVRAEEKPMGEDKAKTPEACMCKNNKVILNKDKVLVCAENTPGCPESSAQKDATPQGTGVLKTEPAKNAPSN